MDFFKECRRAIKRIEDSTAYKQFMFEYEVHEKIIVLGNGGSNAIASHIAQDFTKRGGKVGMSFSDPSMLTCFMNDYGVEEAYKKYLEAFADKNTLVILISSSGNSDNIVRCVEYCESVGMCYGVLTAFDPYNRVRETVGRHNQFDRVREKVGGHNQFDYYVNTMSYGVAECVHQIFLHGAVE